MARYHRQARFGVVVCVLSLVGSAACRPKAEPNPPPSADSEFLLVNRAGELVLRSPAGPARVLARSVRSAHYDASLELVWLEGDDLRVIDLRRLDAGPVVIARSWPHTSSFSIDHPASSVGDDQTCDVGEATLLTWDEAPKLQRIEEQVRDLPLDGMDWLRAELRRPVRAAPDAAASSLRHQQRRVVLPEGVARCEDPDECGRAVAFGALGIELVLAVTLRGDCWHPYCLFHEPASGAWSSPLVGARWSGAAGNRAGPCGVFAFDRSGKRFLLGDQLCGPGEHCEKLEGTALGWRDPGPLVGAPSDLDMAPDAE